MHNYILFDNEQLFHVYYVGYMEVDRDFLHRLEVYNLHVPIDLHRMILVDRCLVMYDQIMSHISDIFWYQLREDYQIDIRY